MKIEVIESFCGIEVGTQKTVADGIAKNLIERKLAKEVKSDEAPKGKKATKTEETTTE
jgi:hypothetical protein